MGNLTSLPGKIHFFRPWQQSFTIKPYVTYSAKNLMSGIMFLFWGHKELTFYKADRVDRHGAMKRARRFAVESQAMEFCYVKYKFVKEELWQELFPMNSDDMHSPLIRLVLLAIELALTPFSHFSSRPLETLGFGCETDFVAGPIKIVVVGLWTWKMVHTPDS